MTNLLFRRLCFVSKLANNSALSTSIPNTLVLNINRQFLKQNLAMVSFTKSISSSSMRLKDTGDPKDRTREIPLEKSMLYLESDAYLQTYGKKRIWELYRRNYNKGRLHAKSRITCIRNEYITTGNPCPICRDEYLVVDYRNLKLIEQFIDDYNGRVYSTNKTGICQRQHKKLLWLLI